MRIGLAPSLFGLLALSCSSSHAPGGLEGGANGGADASAGLSVTLFDVAESAWGEAPLSVHFVWRIAGAQGRALTCQLDLDGDGSIDVQLPGCAADTTATPAASLPAHTFTQPGELRPRLLVSDGQGTAQATTSVFANHLELADNVVFPEKLPGFMKADATAGGRVLLTFASGTAPGLKAGDIIWGSTGGGYLLAVGTIAAAGGTLIVDGTPAAITSAIKNGFFGARDVAAPFADPRCVGNGCGELSFTKITRPATPPAGGARALTLEGSGQTGLNIEFPRGLAGISSSLFVGLNVERFLLEIQSSSLVRATISITPSIEYELVVQAAVTGKWPNPLDPRFALHLGVIPIGPFLIDPALFPQLQLTASVKAGFKTGFELPVSLDYGEGKWTRQAEAKPTPPLIEKFDPPISVSDSLDAALVFKLQALVLGIGGPYVAPSLHVSVAADGSFSERCGKQLCYSATAGIQGSYGADIPWIPGASVEAAPITVAANATFWKSCTSDGSADSCTTDGGTDAVPVRADASASADAPAVDGGVDAGGVDAPAMAPEAGSAADAPAFPDAATSDADAQACTQGTRYRYTGTTLWNDLIYDCMTGLTWHFDVERTKNALPPCDISLTIKGDTAYCCTASPADPNGYYLPACNWLGFQQICNDEGWRLATKDELVAVTGRDGFYANNWSSWSAMSSPNHAFYVRVTGLLVGATEYTTNGDQHIWYAKESVRCVRSP
jgi:hypothetical protein